MATHQDYKKFAVKYNREFKIAGVHKMKKADLINAIEERLNKSRKEIKEEYKQLKNMVKEKKTPAPKKTPVKKGDIEYNKTTLQRMVATLADFSSQYTFTKAQLDKAYPLADKLLSSYQAREWKGLYEDKYKKPTPKKTPSKIDKIKKEEKKEKIIQKKKDDKELKLKSNLSKMLYNKMFGYMTGSSKKSYTEDELLFAYKYKDDFLDGDQLSEWKRVYNDNRRVGKIKKKN